MDTNLINRPRHAAVPTGFRYVISLSGFLFLGALWQLAVHIRGSPALPPLGAVLRTAFSLILDRSFFRHILTSMEIIVFGIFLATAVGFCAGVLLFRYRKLKESVLPVIECVRGIAALTLFPLLIITFGIGTVSRVFVIFWTAWPAIVLSTMNSLSVDPHIVDAARTGGAAEWKIITHIRIPMAMHGLITGLRIGVGGGWVSLITAEMLGASKGLGFYLLCCSQSFEFAKVYAVILIIAAIGGLMNFALLYLQHKTILITGEL